MQRLAFTFPIVASIGLVVDLAAAQDTRLASQGGGVVGDASSGYYDEVDVTTDGNGDLLVVFSSAASNLLKGDFNGVHDVFLRNVTKGTIERLSVSAAGAEGDGDSNEPTLTPDGRYVVFTSVAGNLVAGDTNGQRDVYLVDRKAGTIELASLAFDGSQASERCDGASVSDDGRFVVFTTAAPNMAKPGVDANGWADVFVRDRGTPDTRCVSVNSSGVTVSGFSTSDHADGKAISGDGSKVLFSSDAGGLVSGDTNGVQDALVRDLALGTTTRVSLDASGAQLATMSYARGLSPKGTIALFHSEDSAVLPGFSNGELQLYAKILASGELLPAAAQADGDPLDSFPFYYPYVAIAGDDGSDFDPLIAFTTYDQDVVPDPGLPIENLFVRRLRGGDVQHVSVDSDGAPGVSGWITAVALSTDGTQVAFSSLDAFAAPDSGIVHFDVYVRGLCWTRFTEFGAGTPGTGGYVPHLSGRGASCEELAWTLSLEDGLGGAPALLYVGDSKRAQNLFGGIFWVDLTAGWFSIPLTLGGAPGVGGDGSFLIEGENAEEFVGSTFFLQCLVADRQATRRIAMSNAVQLDIE